MIADLAGLLEGLTNWSDADTYVKNDGQPKDDTEDGTEWHNNGRVFQHSGTGTYLCFALANGYANSFRYDARGRGVSILHSEDWDTTAHEAAGKTTRYYESIPGGLHRTDSFETYLNDKEYNDSYPGRNGGLGLWYRSDTNGSRADEVSYFMSAREDGIAVGCWGSQDDGIACFFAWQHVTDKFWNDGVEPHAIVCRWSNDGSDSYVRDYARYPTTTYGWSTFAAATERYRRTHGTVGFTDGMIDEAKWGYVNPNPNDDTYFFQYPVIYRGADQTAPVAYFTEALPNEAGSTRGLQHGDQVTVDGNTYRIFRQTGGNPNMDADSLHTAALRYD